MRVMQIKYFAHVLPINLVKKLSQSDAKCKWQNVNLFSDKFSEVKLSQSLQLFLVRKMILSKSNRLAIRSFHLTELFENGNFC